MLTVVKAGLQTLVVDGGRIGFGHLGVPRSGALDLDSLARANKLVGNSPTAAGLECLLRGPVLEASGRRLALVAGGVSHLSSGDRIDAARLPALRAWIAVEGGIATGPVLGSRSSDLLGRLGPRPLEDGDEMPLGPADGTEPPVLASLVSAPSGEPLKLLAGPDTVALAEGPWTVTPNSDRTALRLKGPAKPHALPGRTRGLVPGAIQVPPDGNPVIFLAGHPTTGGYPIAGFVRTSDLGRLAQLRPGQTVEFRPPRPLRRRK